MLIDWLIDCCLKSLQDFFNHISGRRHWCKTPIFARCLRQLDGEGSLASNTLGGRCQWNIQVDTGPLLKLYYIHWHRMSPTTKKMLLKEVIVTSNWIKVYFKNYTCKLYFWLIIMWETFGDRWRKLGNFGVYDPIHKGLGRTLGFSRKNGKSISFYWIVQSLASYWEIVLSIYTTRKARDRIAILKNKLCKSRELITNPSERIPNPRGTDCTNHHYNNDLR